MKQTCFPRRIASIICFMLSFLMPMGYAQEKKSLTMPLDGGTLTFQYYEKDGMKVPDGLMEFKKGNYTEKGECKNGYRECKWIAKRGNNKAAETIEYNFQKGMLEGSTVFRSTATDKSQLKHMEPDATYNFHNGRLFGENKVVILSDTIYCNFGEDGKRIGTWKMADSKGASVILEYNEDPKLRKAYKVDVLGQKEPLNFGQAEMQAFMSLLHFDNKFRQVIFSMTDRHRPNLPTLCENKYGYQDVWVKMDEEE